MEDTTQPSTKPPLPLTFDTTYVVSNERYQAADMFAMELLKTRFDKNVIPSRLKPLETVGDGKCFLHAVSSFLMGVDSYDGDLRKLLIKEVNENKQFYLDSVVAARMKLCEGDEEMKDTKKKAEKTEELFCQLVSSCEGSDDFRSNWSGLDEAFVLANAIKRPIIVYASANDVSEWGESLMGVGGAFLPLRHKPEDCVSKQPILISWSYLGVHFCPLVRVKGWDSKENGPIKFPQVKPALIRHLSLGDPISGSGSGSLSEEEDDAMKKYVNYDEPLKIPPDPNGPGPSPGPSPGPVLKIPGFKKTKNPDDELEYDIVIPVDVGKTVTHIAFDFGENYVSKVAEIMAKYCDGSRYCYKEIITYIRRIIYYIRVDYNRNFAGYNKKPSDEMHIPKLIDFVPIKIVPSIPCVNEEPTFVAVAESVRCSPSIPVSVPCRFNEELSDRAMSGLVEAVCARYDGQSNTLVEGLYLLQEYISKAYLEKFSRESTHPKLAPEVHHEYVLPRLAICCNCKSFELFELYRYVALCPIMCPYIAENFESIVVFPNEKDQFCVHVAFIKLLANIFSCLPAINTSDSNDFCFDITESNDFKEYLEKASKSKSPELLLPLSVMFLNVAAMNFFSPLNVLVARYYPRILHTALSLKHKPLLSNILMGLATLVYNDTSAKETLKSCRPLESLLAQVEHIASDSITPYADLCKTAIFLEEDMM